MLPGDKLHSMIHNLIAFSSFSRVIDTQQELDEYTENSASLEKELEASLEQVERQNRDLENQNQRLKNEIELLRVNIMISAYRNVEFRPHT